jgi:hypothetical protein
MLTLAALVLSLGACSRDDGALGPEVTSPPRESSGSDSRDPEGDSSDRGNSSEPGAESTPDTSLPDLGDLDDCVGLAGTYAGLAFSVIGGPDAAAEAQPVIDELRPRLPEDLQDDLDVVADAFTRIVEDGVLEGIGALADSDFQEANGNITDYLQENCLGG